MLVIRGLTDLLKLFLHRLVALLFSNCGRNKVSVAFMFWPNTIVLCHILLGSLLFPHNSLEAWLLD